ncbi:MAG TPA: hypothetical protein VEH52_08115 [Gaiellaceae bacterium]|nr:hypothetical protein [Gaiellaceae bacterium]
MTALAGRRFLVSVGALLALLMSVSALAAGSGSYQIRYNADDQAAARAALLRRADLKPSSGWSGGQQKVTKDNLEPVTCANLHPSVSDLVITGAAGAEWWNGPLDLTSLAVVFRTTRMEVSDWQRTTTPPAAVSCLETSIANGLGPGGKLQSFEKISFPKVAPRTLVFRLLAQTRSQGLTVPLTLYVVALARGRTEITLLTSGLAGTPTKDAVARLARILAARARA